MPSKLNNNIDSKEKIQACFTRVFEAAECSTQEELAGFLGISQSSISDAKKRGSIPAEWLLKLLYFRNINPAWILVGENAKYLHPLHSDEQVHKVTNLVFQNKKSPTLEEWSMEELFAELMRRAKQKSI